jgi:hypothetical protein
MLPHLIPLPHRFLQPWIKLRKCTIQNHNNLYIQVIHAYFTNYIHEQYTHASLSLEVIDLPANKLIIDAMYNVINIPTYYYREIAGKIKNRRILLINQQFSIEICQLLPRSPVVVPGSTNRPIQPIFGAMRATFALEPAISGVRCRLELCFGAKAILGVAGLLFYRQRVRKYHLHMWWAPKPARTEMAKGWVFFPTVSNASGA